MLTFLQNMTVVHLEKKEIALSDRSHSLGGNKEKGKINFAHNMRQKLLTITQVLQEGLASMFIRLVYHPTNNPVA
jgi:hypothetical protein